MAQRQAEPAPAEVAKATSTASLADAVFDKNDSQAADVAATSTFQLLDAETARSVASEELQSALTQLESGPEDPRNLLTRLFVNILRDPLDTKYRRIRLGNPKIQAAIVDADGGLELLQVSRLNSLNRRTACLPYVRVERKER